MAHAQAKVADMDKLLYSALVACHAEKLGDSSARQMMLKFGFKAGRSTVRSSRYRAKFKPNKGVRRAVQVDLEFPNRSSASCSIKVKNPTPSQANAYVQTLFQKLGANYSFQAQQINASVGQFSISDKSSDKVVFGFFGFGSGDLSFSFLGVAKP